MAGIDEAGRGPLAGPVVAAAVVFWEEKFPAGLDDSKKLTPARREKIYDELILSPWVEWGCAEVSAGEIDSLNILRATHEAMRRAVAGLRVSHAIVDGLPVEGLPVPHDAVVGGDGRSLSVAAASVIAKVTRDRIMVEADTLYPLYGFAAHKGYGTVAHLKMLRKHGPCPIHRRTFAPVAQSTLFPL